MHGKHFCEFILSDNLYLILIVLGLNLCCNYIFYRFLERYFKEINNFYKIKETIGFMDLQIEILVYKSINS